MHREKKRLASNSLISADYVFPSRRQTFLQPVPTTVGPLGFKLPRVVDVNKPECRQAAETGG